MDHSTADTMDPKPPSVAIVGGIDERGRSTRKVTLNKNRAEWVLGKKTSGASKGKEGFANRTKT